MQDDIDRPKVIEALLGTRLRGNEFARSPLVCCGAQVSCNAAGLQAPGFMTCEIETVLHEVQIGGSRNTLAIDADGQVRRRQSLALRVCWLSYQTIKFQLHLSMCCSCCRGVGMRVGRWATATGVHARGFSWAQQNITVYMTFTG